MLENERLIVQWKADTTETEKMQQELDKLSKEEKDLQLLANNPDRLAKLKFFVIPELERKLAERKVVF